MPGAGGVKGEGLWGEVLEQLDGRVGTPGHEPPGEWVAPPGPPREERTGPPPARARILPLILRVGLVTPRRGDPVEQACCSEPLGRRS